MYPCPAHGKGKIKASVWDITAKPPSVLDDLSSLSLDESARPPATTFQLPEGVEPGSVDVLTVIYVLSALRPKEWEQAIHNLYTVCCDGSRPTCRSFSSLIFPITLKNQRSWVAADGLGTETGRNIADTRLWTERSSSNPN